MMELSPIEIMSSTPIEYESLSFWMIFEWLILWICILDLHIIDVFLLVYDLLDWGQFLLMELSDINIDPIIRVYNI